MAISRRSFLTALGATSASAFSAADAGAALETAAGKQRSCVVLLDGFGTDYYERSNMPTLTSWARHGFFKRIQGVMPSVTNTNIAGACCGVYADEHGITANSYWDAQGQREQFMSDGQLLSAPTLFERAARFGVRSAALVSAKQKTIPLLNRGTTLAIGAQQAPPGVVRQYGPPPDIYSLEVNYWVWQVALDIIKNRREIGLIFVHTTDFPMHRYPPEAGESRAHLQRIDDFLKQAAEADSSLAFFVTADHGMNGKTTVVNLERAVARRGVVVEVAMSTERDQYPRHHNGYGGTAFVYLKEPGDLGKTIKALQTIVGVEEVLTRDDAAKKYRLNAQRIGDVWVTATRTVVFGHSAQEREDLPKGYRSHGSRHELDIPCFIYRYGGKLPDPGEVRTNVDVCSVLYRG